MNHTAEIKKIKETKKGTYLQVFVPGSYLETTIERHKQKNKAYAVLRLDDNRTITAQQRKKYYATLKDISDHTGYLTEELHDYFKLLYKYLYEDINISMSNCTVAQANQMITLLIDYIINNDVPLSDLAINRVSDVDRYIYMCIVKRKCACCGKDRSDFHHSTTVGMGRNRNKINHVGMEGFTLCREHHTELHKIGEKEFQQRHKVYPLKLDEYAVKKLGL